MAKVGGTEWYYPLVTAELLLFDVFINSFNAIIVKLKVDEF